MADPRAIAPEELEIDGVASAVGRRIQARRLELGLTQAEVAAGMLSPSYLSLVESGRRQPAESALEHIASRLGVDAGFLQDGIDAEARRRSRRALGQAEIALQRGEGADAHKRFMALEVDAGLSDEQQRQARFGRARAARAMGDLDEAIEILRELASAAQRAPGVHPWLDVATELTRCYRAAGDIDLAVQTGEQAMRDAADLGLGGSAEYVRLGCTVVDAYHDRGDLAAASRLGADLVAVAEDAGSAQARGVAYANAAGIAESRGQIAQALSLTDRALNVLGDGDDEQAVARLRVAQAGLMLAQDPTTAARALELVDEVYAEMSSRSAGNPVEANELELGWCEAERARALLALGRLDAARAAADASIGRLNGKARLEAARAHTILGRILLAGGDTSGCLDECKVAASTLGELGVSYPTASGWRELGGLYKEADRASDALDAYERALGAAHVR